MDVGGRRGIMVAGGYNNRQGYLRSAEYLDLGVASGGLRDLSSLKWRNLPDMKDQRGNKMVLINDE